MNVAIVSEDEASGKWSVNMRPYDLILVMDNEGGVRVLGSKTTDEHPSPQKATVILSHKVVADIRKAA